MIIRHGTQKMVFVKDILPDLPDRHDHNGRAYWCDLFGIVRQDISLRIKWENWKRWEKLGNVNKFDSIPKKKFGENMPKPKSNGI